MRVLLCVLILTLTACGRSEPAVNLALGDDAPTFQAHQLDGVPIQFPGGYFGRPVVIRFWADWCKYCEGEMKAIEGVYQRNKGKGLEVLAINAGQDRKTVAAFMSKIGVSYPAVLDEQSKVARSFGVTGLPTTFFVDARGKIANKVIGEADEATFERLASDLLK